MTRTLLLIFGATLMNRCAHPSTRLRHTFGFVLLPAALVTAALAEDNQPPRSQDPPVLIWDIDLKLANDGPRNFRTTNDRLNESNGETTATTGLSQLRASGSGEFTPEGLKVVLARTQGPVTVFDLRQETHLFVNDLPVSWYASHDWANVGRTQAEIENQETSRCNRLSPAAKSMSGPASRSNMGTAILPRRNG